MFLSPEPKNRIAVRLVQAMEEGKGYGTAMLDHAIAHAKAQGKDIISDPEGGTKPAAASLFQKRGAKKIKYDSPEGYVWLIKTKHKFYRPDQARDESGKFEDEGRAVGPKPFKSTVVAKAEPAPRETKPRTDLHKTLTTGKVTSFKALGSGTVAKSKIVTFDDGERAVYKPMEGEKMGQRRNIDGSLFLREAAASDVAESIGLHDLVPATDVGHGPDGLGSFQHFVPDSMDAIKMPDVLHSYDGDKDLGRAAAFDYLIGNSDRHPKNWMVGMRGPGKGKLALIDNGLSFPNQQGESFANSFLYDEAKFRHLPVSDEVRRWVDKMPEIREKLSKRGLTKLEIDGVEGRARILSEITNFDRLKHFPDEIDDSWR